MRSQIVCAATAVLLLGVRFCIAAEHGPADVVATDARIYKARADRGMAEALAMLGGKIVFVGSAADAHAWIGPQTKVLHLAGKLVLPGLFDSHIHPLGIVDLDVCNLADEGHADDIRNTAVLETWFMGKSVYVGKGRNLNAQRGLTQ
jgi:hypothetical protein